MGRALLSLMVAWPKEECCTKDVRGLLDFQENGICCQFLKFGKQGSAAPDPGSLSTLAILTRGFHAGASALDGSLESCLLVGGEHTLSFQLHQDSCRTGEATCYLPDESDGLGLEPRLPDCRELGIQSLFHATSLPTQEPSLASYVTRIRMESSHRSLTGTPEASA